MLEFGCGYSTIVIEAALAKNKEDWEALENKPEIRNRDLFKSVSIDTHQRWIAECQQYCKNKIMHSDAIRIANNNQFCHVYRVMPTVLPDFIYIDGPDPKEVMDWGYDMPMSADLLYMEPVLIPGTIVLIDGRTNNARFLARNLKRKWVISEDREGDYTLMILNEERLGKINAIGRDVLNDITKG